MAKRSSAPTKRTKGKRVIFWVAVGLIPAGSVAAAGLLYVKEKGSMTASEDPMKGTGISAPMVDRPSLSRDLNPLLGRWRRPDGGYVIEVRGFDASCRLEARCYNPRSIHVACAEASKVGGKIKIFL